MELESDFEHHDDDILLVSILIFSALSLNFINLFFIM